MDVETVVRVTKELYDMGCYEVSLGDTIGVGTPVQVESLLRRLCEEGVHTDRYLYSTT